MRILREPLADAALAFLRAEIAALREGRGHLVQVAGECSIHYAGRATSTLSRGERLVMLKPDGTLLVHTASRAKPVNWMPPGGSFSVALEDGTLVLSAQRASPAEVVRIELHAISALLAFPLRDREELVLMRTEGDLHEALRRAPHLVERGVRFTEMERPTARGPIDLYGMDGSGRRVLVEAKRARAGIDEATQLWRYVEMERSAKGDGVRGFLVAPEVSDVARKLLAEKGLEWREISWDQLLPVLDAPLPSGQATLGRYDGVPPRGKGEKVPRAEVAPGPGSPTPCGAQRTKGRTATGAKGRNSPTEHPQPDAAPTDDPSPNEAAAADKASPPDVPPSHGASAKGGSGTSPGAGAATRRTGRRRKL